MHTFWQKWHKPVSAGEHGFSPLWIPKGWVWFDDSFRSVTLCEHHPEEQVAGAQGVDGVCHHGQRQHLVTVTVSGLTAGRAQIWLQSFSAARDESNEYFTTKFPYIVMPDLGHLIQSECFCHFLCEQWLLLAAWGHFLKEWLRYQ